ncbi:MULTISPECIES: metallopeptidase family protein [unclassified Frondihabitans]|jgi:hypothetical protein|uniref:metallopeptidase family protein n=1 Tax=unclassified Frondihabitans TaxID=2626248 RepID=UPI000F4D3EB9|nr:MULTISPECIES: metallopeptidase family protein [unclassified Frondihabitans]RPE79083.1 hypothetical protein EDF37_1772 [Frondihabitans sp. PhB153]RPF09363.1 hypothetical protein EDF39_1774 [Frondihabitans sp. PhB161]
MARSRSARVSGRSGFRDRHGRGPRSSVAGPHLPFLETRIDRFDDIVASAAQYLRELWPDELEGVVFEVAGLPAGVTAELTADERSRAPGSAGAPRLDRWRVDVVRRRILLYRLPIERLARPHETRSVGDDPWQHRMLVEGYVFRAVGDFLGKDPWELAPDRYRDR